MFDFNSSFEAESIMDKCGNLSGIEERKETPAEIIATTIAIVTVLENTVILIAIATGPTSLRKPPYWFIASLAAADLLTGIGIVLAVFVPVGDSPLSRIALKVSSLLLHQDL